MLPLALFPKSGPLLGAATDVTVVGAVGVVPSVIAASRWRTRSAPSACGNRRRYSSNSVRAFFKSPARSQATPMSSCASRENLLGGRNRIWFRLLIAAV